MSCVSYPNEYVPQTSEGTVVCPPFPPVCPLSGVSFWHPAGSRSVAADSAAAAVLINLLIMVLMLFNHYCSSGVMSDEIAVSCEIEHNLVALKRDCHCSHVRELPCVA